MCPPERDRLGGPPERSEGGEGARMAGPLRAPRGKGIVADNLIYSYLILILILTMIIKRGCSAYKLPEWDR